MSRIGRAGPSFNTSHLNQRGTQPSRQLPQTRSTGLNPRTTPHFHSPTNSRPSRIGNIATQTFIAQNPSSTTVYRGQGRPASIGYQRVKPTSCWASFVAILACIFCFGCLTKADR